MKYGFSQFNPCGLHTLKKYSYFLKLFFVFIYFIEIKCVKYVPLSGLIHTEVLLFRLQNYKVLVFNFSSTAKMVQNA